MVAYSYGTGNEQTHRPLPKEVKSAKFYDLVMHASIILVKGHRVEQFTVNVYTRAVSLSVAGDLTDQVYSGDTDVVVDAEGRASIHNVRGVPYTFEFYHAQPFNK